MEKEFGIFFSVSIKTKFKVINLFKLGKETWSIMCGFISGNMSISTVQVSYRWNISTIICKKLFQSTAYNILS